MPRMAMAPIQRSVTLWKRRQSRPSGWMRTPAFSSGMVIRPWTWLSCRSRSCSLTELAVGLTDAGCCAPAGIARQMRPTKVNAPSMMRMRASIAILPSGFSGRRGHPLPRRRSLRFCRPPWRPLRRDRFAIGGLPAPGAGAVAALHHPLLVDLGDDVAVAGEQRLGRAHLGAQWQLAFGEAIGAVLDVLRRRAVRLGSAGTVGALVHLAARSEVADPRILRGAERTGVETIAAADADVLGVEDDGVGGRVERVGRAHRRARRVGAVHARHRDRALARLPVVEGHDAPAVDAPRHVVLVLAGGDAGVAFNATVGVAEKFHRRHGASPMRL